MDDCAQDKEQIIGYQTIALEGYHFQLKAPTLHQTSNCHKMPDNDTQ
jgi:hypothetical protein